MEANYCMQFSIPWIRKPSGMWGGVGWGGVGWGGVGVVENLIPVRGDVQNLRISTVEHLYVVGALLLQIVYGIRYSN